MTDGTKFEDFERDLEGIQDAIGDTALLTSEFKTELARAQVSLAGTSREVGRLSSATSRGIKRALDGLVLGEASLSDALEGVTRSILNSAYSIATRPVTDGVGDLVAGGLSSLFGGLFEFADGAGFVQGRVMPFANGGVVGGPTYFPMRGGTGLMGEAGPEAIMPLSRGADGRLGVRAETGGRMVNVTMNVTTPNVEGFRRSQTQIAAQMARVMGRGVRNR